MDSSGKGLTLSEAALFGILGALTFGAKLVMAGLPNIEPVSLFVMLFAVTFGRKALFPIYIYVLLELILYGFGPWNLGYLYVWALLAAAAWRLRAMTSPLGWGLLAAVFGLLFGLLFTPIYLAVGGVGAAVAWWVSGLYFDLLHCAGNFVIALALFNPLRKLLDRLYGQLRARG